LRSQIGFQQSQVAGRPLDHDGIAHEEDMSVLDKIAIDMAAENVVTVTSETTVGHFVADMPQVYATPMMIMHMEMASGFAIASYLPDGFCQRRNGRQGPSPRGNSGRPHRARHFSRYRDRPQEYCVRG
jgi:hypothetical protein